jgi:hypothetical protein
VCAPHDEQEVKAGEVLVVDEQTNDEWWLASKNGEQGWVPAGYLKIR